MTLEAVGFYITQKLKRGELDELLAELENEKRQITELHSLLFSGEERE